MQQNLHPYYMLKAYLLRQKDGLYMLVLLGSSRWHWCAGSKWFQILYETSKYLPGHQRHLVEVKGVLTSSKR